MSLYNRYGAMVYGVILQIVPEEQFAQEVLVDVFKPAQLNHLLKTSSHLTGAIIRLARAKALETREKLAHRPDHREPVLDGARYLPEHIFDLSFRQGHTPDTIAGQLGIPRSEVLKAIREYVHTFRQP